jgi:hypothetical protein
MLLHRPDLRGKPMALIKYHIKAKLITSAMMDKEIKYKQVLIVREPPTNFAIAIN